MSRAGSGSLQTSRPGSTGVHGVNRAINVLWLPVLLFVLWWVATARSTSPFFPPLQDILSATWTQWVVFNGWPNFSSSIVNLLIGYVCGCGIGLIGGSILWRLRRLRTATSPLVYFLYVLPAPALLPAMMAIFGVSDMRKIALIAFGATWPTLLNTLDGMRGIDIVKFDTARALRLGGWRQYFTLVLPGAAPQITAGLRASLSVSIILVVVSEMVAARSGIGYFILQSQAQFAVTNMWTGIVVLAILGVVLNYLFMFGERVVLRWYYRSRSLGAS
jgi:ABC-type nitrate/sulfonate/bicarbonate transport system permease component